MVFSYGTAGFRTHSDHLDQVCFRCGILVAIRAKMEGSSGLMITASHNHRDDNGVKIIEHNGDVLPVSWEPFAELIVNSTNLEYTLTKVFDKMYELDGKQKEKDMEFSINGEEHVSFGIDTRESGERLVNQAMKAI